jgi:hypothetical protein
MSEFNKFYKKIKRTASKAVKKTGEVAEIAGKYVKLQRLDSKLSDRYEDLGRLTYKQLKSGESYAEKIALVIDAIDHLRASIKALNEEIEADKAKYKGDSKKDSEDGENLTKNSDER